MQPAKLKSSEQQALKTRPGEQVSLNKNSLRCPAAPSARRVSRRTHNCKVAFEMLSHERIDRPLDPRPSIDRPLPAPHGDFGDEKNGLANIPNSSGSRKPIARRSLSPSAV